MKLNDFPDKLYKIEMELIPARRLVGNRRETVRRNEATLKEAAAGLDRKKYPNAEARNAWLEIQLGAESHMTYVRQLEEAEDSLSELEAKYDKYRRKWKVAQIRAQMKMRELASRGFDERPEDPQPVDTWEDGDGPDEGPGRLNPPEDDLPF